MRISQIIEFLEAALEEKGDVHLNFYTSEAHRAAETAEIELVLNLVHKKCASLPDAKKSEVFRVLVDQADPDVLVRQQYVEVWKGICTREQWDPLTGEKIGGIEGSWTYFATSKRTPEVKIGFTKNPAKRLAGLTTSDPTITISAAVFADPGLEKFIHTKFAGCRVHGEWFLFPFEIESPMGFLEKLADEYETIKKIPAEAQ